MRLLHTSDWHLGLELAGHDRLEEQARFLAWLREQCRERSPDALLVAGDVYDVANPSSAAQRLLADFLVALHQDCPATTVILTGGNHDSAARLEILRPFGPALGRLQIVGGLDARDPELEAKAVVVLRDRAGVALGTCLAVPFLRIGDLDCRPGDDETPAAAYAKALAALYGRLAASARRLVPERPVVAMGHLTVTGAERTGSEHVLVGGIDGVAVEPLVGGLDYLALGHLHRGQRVGADHVRYAGSPLSIAFDERRYAHELLLVELTTPGEPPKITALEVPQSVALLRIPERPGSLAELERAFAAVAWDQYAKLPPSLHPFVELQVLDDGTLPELRARVDALCAERPLRLIGSPRRIPPAAGADAATSLPPPALELDAPEAPRRLFEQAWQKRHQAPPPAEIGAAFAEILAEVHRTRSEP